LLSAIRSYFSLERPVLGGSGVDRQVVLFTGVIAGSVGQWVFTGLQEHNFPATRLALGLIASIVTFPAIFQKAGLNQVKVSLVKWCVAFQSGFFWPALLDQVAKGKPGHP
jgi:hypothetical protein